MILRLRPLALVIALSSPILASRANAQSEPPAGPPWDQVCAPMEQGSFRQIFTSDQCAADFEAAFAANDVPGMGAWMREHRACFHEWAHFPWLAFLRHDPKMATLAWDHQLAMVKERLIGPTSCQDPSCVPGEVEALLAKGVDGAIGAEAVAHTKAFLDEVDKDQSYKKSMDKAFEAVTPMCLYHGDLRCGAAMRKALTWMYPRSYRLDVVPKEAFTFSMMPLYRELFADAKTQRAASRFALDIMRAMAAGTFPADDARTLYERGLQAFEGDQDRFWKFMAVYATRGAAWATAYKMVHADNQPLFAAFMVISAAMGYADTVGMAKHEAWSYGPVFRTSCFQPKPYHFWMTASFAYLLMRDGTPAKTAELVARLLGAMYELGSTTMDREPEAVFFVPAFDTKVNRARRELTHHFLGAKFGQHPDKPAPQDFDATYRALMDASKPLPAMSDDEMRREIKDNLKKWRLWTDLTGFYFDKAFALIPE